MRILVPLVVIISAAFPFLAGCGGGSDGGGTGTLIVEATDAPFEQGEVRSATICVTRILVHASDSAASGFHTIYDGEPIEFDLVDLRNGITEHLAAADVPSGRYKQLRLVISKSDLIVEDGTAAGKTYSTNDGTINPTSAGSSGFKVKLEPPVDVTDGFSTTLVLDFLLTKTFHPIPSSVSDPADADSFNLQPTIRTFTSVGAEIQGTVTDAGTNPIEAATVEVFPEDPDNPGMFLPDSFAETATDANGEYSVPGLPARDYRIVVTKDASTDQRDVTANAGDILTEDFTL
jgi:hypothetical protein